MRVIIICGSGAATASEESKKTAMRFFMAIRGTKGNNARGVRLTLYTPIYTR